jgi:hypothetical protein
MARSVEVWLIAMTRAFAFMLLLHRTDFADDDTACALAHLDYHHSTFTNEP